MELQVDSRLLEASLTDNEDDGNLDNNTSGDRFTVFAAGPPGCGKTTAISDFINEYLPEDGIIYLFSPHKEERSMNTHLLTKRIKMEPEILEKITLERLRNDSPGKPIICVFDDIDLITGKKQKIIQQLMEEILANGRSHNNWEQHIHVLITSHALNDYRKTKYTTENCEYFILFPTRTRYTQLSRLFEKCGIEKKDLKLISSLPHRRVLYHPSCPNFINKF